MIYKQTFEIPQGTLTSLVMDQDDFGLLLHMIEQTGMLTMRQLNIIEQDKHLPLMSKGTKTQPIFDHFNVETDLLSAIVRGHSAEVIKKFKNQLK